MTHGHELKGGNVGGRGCARWSGVKGGKWDNCNSMINKIYFLKIKKVKGQKNKLRGCWYTTGINTMVLADIRYQEQCRNWGRKQQSRVRYQQQWTICNNWETGLLPFRNFYVISMCEYRFWTEQQRKSEDLKICGRKKKTTQRGTRKIDWM